jgi:SAM-dependent methyltransferase
MSDPSRWLLENIDLVARDELVLDVATGDGRNALYLAAHGWRVHAVDRNQDALAALDAHARSLDDRVQTRCVDLEDAEVDLGINLYGTILVFRYLYRPLLPALVAALKPGGVLLYETFTIGQRERGHPRNPAFLLDNGELPLLVAPLVVLRRREGDFSGSLVASVAARKQLP